MYVTHVSINNDVSELKKGELITGVLFTIYSLLFGLTGYLILRRLRMFFKAFYTENKNMIIFATFGLMFSLLLRGIIDLTRYCDDKFSDHVKKYANIYNAFLLVVCDIIPIFFQLSTLIFGYIRKRNDKRYRLEVERRKEYGNTDERKKENKDKAKDSQTSEYSFCSSNNSSYFDPPLLKTCYGS